MPTNWQQHKGLSKWTHRFKTMVRYRLLILTSAPIFLTLIALIGITIYWSIHYTWQNALLDVSERLGVANNSVTLLQQKQANYVRAFADSYDFRTRINQGTPQDELQKWVTEQKKRYSLDFLSFQRVNSMENKFRFMDLTKRESFFDVLNREELEQLDPELAKRAEVPILADGGMEARGLVSRTVIPVYSQANDLIGFLDGGLLLNNSTVLVDQIRDLIYLSDNDRLRPVGTLTVFLDDLRVSTNVPLDSDHRLGRAIGTRVSAEVYNQVLSQGQQWVDRAYVYDAWYITAYQPIRDQYDNVIGMLYTGYLMWPFVKAYMTNIAEISLITLMLLLVSGVMVYRGSRDLFRPIERIHKVVKLVQLGKEKRIGPLGLDDHHELAQLARQFDNMLDALEDRKIELKNAAAQLECKVQERTASLREKTEELELHIQLLNQTRDKLVVHEKLAALGELTAGIAHEINNPTAVILGNVELIHFELGEDASRVQEEIDAIHAQIDRIRNITRSLLQYSRQGGVQDEITWQHVNPIIDESITLVKTGTKKRDVEFVTDLQAHTPVEINRHHLLQILVNLQMNAIHAMNGKGKLIVMSADWIEEGEIKGAAIHVIDDGCGIKPENLNRIFSPFYTTKRDGTGLGLSVSQSILSQTGGELKAESEWGKGSTFSIYLPKKAELLLEVTNIA
ncbi:two-component sensor histidine kinase [Vibrio parahaemolyticus]|uniref:sensor histidine kinase n=1 Tax=Vibrio parahaemolyticus TaxID=670 RepID=UPI001A8E253B|nr:cache domain-containing protein [Vibrio parahaemolyticus]EHH1032346.1 two-component sensor histidine kinase [Vibrio parahaemolyticus]MBO0167829.1 cache domain-containing protein [Vibrio parahaemolyticus]MCR9976180.1 cache domain-containing protein [Vibrio parahaemolyticus]MDF4738005.1 cache domain-containing protein [Vibrio parahaemolyticus]MDF4753041.1 cache domain-containing protein [Vibrio parahaemolyticus]